MLSSRFLALSFLYIFYATGLVAADPRNQFGGGNQNCETVQTVTVFRTVTNNSPPPQSTSTPPSVVTQRPGNVNLGNGDNNGNNNNGSDNNKNGGGQSSSVNNRNNNHNTKTTSSVRSTASPPPASTNNRSLAASPSSTSTPPPSSTGTGDPDTSLTLDPSVIQNVNGKGQGAGQVDSLVSTNNFINYCVGKTITDGNQVKTGSCNPTPMGDLPSVDNMPSAKFNSPRNFDTIPANTPFTIALQVNNLVTGTFTNPTGTYFAAPQHLVNGLIQGHSHVAVQPMTSLDSTQPLDPKVFAFFKGLNTPADNNGVLTTTVTNGLPAGFYRVSSIVAAANHQECTGPVAQHGSFNDAVYITVSDNGQNSNNVSDSSTPPVDSTSSTVPSDSSSSSIPSSSLSSPPVSSTSGSSNNGNDKGGKVNQTSPTDSLPASTSSTSPAVSPTPSLPVPTGNSGDNGGGDNNGGKDSNSSSSEPPEPSSTGGENDSKQGDPSSTTPLPTPSPSNGDDNSGTKEPNGGKGPQNDNGSNYKRMQRRSRLA